MIGIELQLQRLTLEFVEKVALRELTTTVDGQIVGVLSANASGKTSLLQIIAGTLAPTAGRVLMDGGEVRLGRRGGISYLPRETGFFPSWQRPLESSYIDRLYKHPLLRTALWSFGTLSGVRPNPRAQRAGRERALGSRASRTR